MNKPARPEPARTAITPTRADDYAEWYQAVVSAADLAESSPVRGCMVIKPWGYAIWENIQRELDQRFKATGHKNAYFPLFIPKSFLEAEAAHVEGFAKECAVVTHHRLVAGPNGGLIPDPEAKLEEPLIVRPTSETIIGASFAKWVQSYRDLPLLINQWANVVRWELRTRLFLRTAEFLWQEGHTAHASQKEAEEETRQMLEVYAEFAESVMAMPVFKGPKTASERFPGAVDTFSIEAMMQDRKALQAGTSHFLGQNFAKASGIKFQSKEEQIEFAWTTSWGVSTRLIGALIMTHSDDDGLVVPPKLAPAHVVILPVVRTEDTREAVMTSARELAKELQKSRMWDQPIRVEVDARDMRGGDKMWEWIKKGAPIRIELGPRDIEGGTLMFARRDQTPKDKQSIQRADVVKIVQTALEEMQAGLFERAAARRREHTKWIDSKAAFDAFFTPKNEGKPEIHGGFAVSPWCGGAACEESIKERLKVTVRCLPKEEDLASVTTLGTASTCVECGGPVKHKALFAKSY